MIDVHSHILPMIDDGSTSIKESIDMLLESKKNGVKTVIATPHCYVRCEEDIVEFLKKREESYNILMDAISSQEESLPDIKLGCEVHMECDISKFDLIKKLAIDESDYILIEMPYGIWNNELFDILYEITLKNLKPVIAHIDRYFEHKDFFGAFFELDLAYQINASSVIDLKMNSEINYLFENAMVQLIGSDMHNTKTRPTRILQAMERIKKIYGDECADYLCNNSRKLLKNEKIEIYDFKKKNILKRIF